MAGWFHVQGSRGRHLSRRASAAGGAAKGNTQILYIQMEFCPRTLAGVLEEGALEEADAWQVLRGILAGLAHIHSQVGLCSVVLVCWSAWGGQLQHTTGI